MIEWIVLASTAICSFALGAFIVHSIKRCEIAKLKEDKLFWRDLYYREVFGSSDTRGELAHVIAERDYYRKLLNESRGVKVRFNEGTCAYRR